MPNQHKPLPPEEEIHQPFEKYFNLELTDHQIAEHLKSHYDTSLYGCSIKEMVLDIKKKFPHRGTLAIRKKLRQEFKNLKQWNNVEGKNSIVKNLMPQWTNKNPRLITKYYLDACRTLEAIPVYTQSDPGNKNNGVANAQTLMRQTLDPTLVGTLQHIWKTEKNNVKSEANWSVMRADLSPGLEDLFQRGVFDGLYDVGVPLENLVFQWIAIPFVQVQLNIWLIHRNQTKPRKYKHKVTPHGIPEGPELLHTKPDFYGIIDFKSPLKCSIKWKLSLHLRTMRYFN
ncbi:hypothetical protein B0H13DRAFT_1912142 [Mycena leptocephala]|nr:hypothetical protein B0H13DRAFT_1912142 [Mycena leptocephala]